MNTRQMAQQDQDDFKKLSTAKVSREFLEANSTQHDQILGAIAELVDNARDAQARKLEIDYDAENEFLTFLDDGCGMTRDDTKNVFNFGHSTKRTRDDQIGRYGNGLKSGSIRLSNDVMIFTKKNDQLTILMLSNTYLTEKLTDEILYINPSFEAGNFNRIFEDEDKHMVEMKIISQQSPFKTSTDLWKQFEKIEGESGTLIVLYGLKRAVEGCHELDFSSDETDICVRRDTTLKEKAASHINRIPFNSLREYLSVLYLVPRMRIILRDVAVNTVRLKSKLIDRVQYDYTGKFMVACAKRKVQELEEEIRKKKNDVTNASNNVGQFNGVDKSVVDKDVRRDRFQRDMAISIATTELKNMQERMKTAIKNIKDPSPLEAVFGINVLKRKNYGCMFYNNGRLIKAFHKMPLQVKNGREGNLDYLGVVCIVDVPYSVMSPTYNKSGFRDQKEFETLVSGMNQLLEGYWTGLRYESQRGGLPEFWKKMGYASKYSEAPSKDCENYVNSKLDHFIQCQLCLKWRKLDNDARRSIGSYFVCTNKFYRGDCNTAEVKEQSRKGNALKEAQLVMEKQKVKPKMPNRPIETMERRESIEQPRNVPSGSKRNREDSSASSRSATSVTSQESVVSPKKARMLSVSSTTSSSSLASSSFTIPKKKSNLARRTGVVLNRAPEEQRKRVRFDQEVEKAPRRAVVEPEVEKTSRRIAVKPEVETVPKRSEPVARAAPIEQPISRPVESSSSVVVVEPEEEQVNNLGIMAMDLLQSLVANGCEEAKVMCQLPVADIPKTDLYEMCRKHFLAEKVKQQQPSESPERLVNISNGENVENRRRKSDTPRVRQAPSATPEIVDYIDDEIQVVAAPSQAK